MQRVNFSCYLKSLQLSGTTLVYLKTKHNQLSKDALYRKMMQYGIKLSTKHPSEANNNFEKRYLKSIIFGKK